MNSILISGRLTRDPERKESKDGIVHTHFSVAVNRPMTGDEQIVDFFNVVTWRGIGEVCDKYLHKGDKVVIQGKLYTSNYEDKNGNARTFYEISADSVEFFATPKEEEKDKKTIETANKRYEKKPVRKNFEVDDDMLPF